MPLRFDIRRKLTARSDRVKSVDLHPTEPWMVVSLYSGTMAVWNHETQTTVKTFEGCDVPVRVAKFVARKHWIVAGGDDMLIRVFNYNTLGRVHVFEAHHDYIRCIAVHPAQPFILTCSDDMLIKLWDWDQKWSCTQVFEGHTHYVMEVVFNPKDNNQFASASLDRTLKVWQLGSRTPNFTLEGHHKGVNSVDYYGGGDKPYLISGADDHLVKIWDYQNKTCVQTLEAHVHNVTCVRFHPELPIILTGSEDGTVRVWHSNTYRLENTLNYGMERVWCVCAKPGSNNVALGYDDGSIIIQLGREEPAMSMDSSGKVIWAHYSEVQQANLKTMGETEIRDGEKLLLGVKDMGSCEIYPQTIQHSPNGRFVVICGDGEYIIYTAMALRNKSFGSAQEFVWAHDSSQYAIREGSTMVKIFKNFKQKTAFKPDFGAEAIFGGFLLGVRSRSGLALYDWESTELIRRIEIQPKHIFWSDSGELVCIATDESFFVLRYLPEKVAAAQESKEEITEDGIEDAFEVLGEISEVVKTGVWVGDCFIFTSSLNRLNYYVGGEIVTIAHLDRTMYLLGYIPKDDRLYLGDKELNVISYSLVLSVLEYQTAVMRRDFGTADKVLPTIPREQRIRVAYFLEKQGYTQQALAVSNDPEHRFELALRLGEVQTAYQLASEAKSEQKWRQLAELATTKCQFSVAQECLLQAQDYGGLLLLATASGSVRIMENLAEGAERNEKTNVAFLAYFLQGRLEKCLDLLIRTDRLPEAAFLARTYLPSHVSRVVKLWKESLSKVNQKAADALADPTEYSNLFPGLQQALLAEQYLKETPLGVRPAAEYPLVTPNEDRNVLEESAGFVLKGMTESEEVAKGFIEPVREAAASEAVGTETALREELIPPKEEITDLLQTEEKSIPVSASSQPVAETEDNVEPKQAESVSSDERATSNSEEASIIVEEDILVTAAEVIQTETVTVKPSSPVDVTSSFETDFQIVPPADDAVSSASETRPGTYKTTEERPSEGPATEEPLVSPALTGGVAECVAKEEISVQKKMGTDVSSPEASIIVNTAAEEICVTDGLVSETAAQAAPVEDPVSSENTASPVPDEPAQVQILTERVLDPLLGPPGDKTQVLEPAVAQEQAQETQTTGLQTKTEDNQELGASQGAEPRVSSPDTAPSEGNISDQDSHHDGASDPAVDLEAELDDETIPPAAAAESIKTAEERASEIPATQDTPVSPGLTSCVSEFLATEELSVHEDTGTDIISPTASLIMNTAEGEICVTDGLVSETAAQAAPMEEPVSSENTASPVPDEPAQTQILTERVLDPLLGPLGDKTQVQEPASPALDGHVQAQTFTELALDPLLDPTEDRTPVLQPAVEKTQEIQATGLSVKPEDNLELVTPPEAELRLSFTDTAPSEDSTTAQEAHLGGVDDPKENLEAELDEETIPPADEALSAASETVKTAEEMPSETAATVDILVSLGLTSVAESVATEEMPANKELGADIVFPVAPLITDTAAGGICITDGLVSETAPVEEPISSEDTANPVQDGLGQDQTFTEPALDPLLDPLEDKTQVLKPAVAQDQAQETQTTGLPAKPGDNQELVAPLGSASPDTAPTGDNTVGQEAHLEGANDPAEDLEAELDDEALGYLDLDDLDLENIDTSDINLDEEFLME